MHHTLTNPELPSHSLDMAADKEAHTSAPPPPQPLEMAPPLVVLLASPGAGHVFPMVELARRLAVQYGFTAMLVTYTNLTPPTHLSVLSTLPPAISTVTLPAVPLDDLPADARNETVIMAVVSRALPHVRSLLRSLKLSPTTRLAAFVPDMFGTPALRVAAELGVPHYLFFTSNLMVIITILHLPELDESTSCEYRDLPEPVRLPGCVPLRGADLFDPVQDRNDPVYPIFVELGRRYRDDAEALLVNSFEAMEPETEKALREAADKGLFPPAYPVGPIILPGSDEADESGCLEWLGRQPARSVLYVSFGSGGTLSSEQTTELAAGLEMSGHRFLWVVRLPSDTDRSASFFGAQTDGDDPLSYLPKGFVERTEATGLVVRQWAPQVRVLQHAATGGFLSHCGWNSTLESAAAGVPMIAWPLYAEQKMNAVMLAERVGLALRPRAWEDGVVAREEVAAAVRELMGSGAAGGQAAHRRAEELREAAASACAPGGSSYDALETAARKWKAAVGMENGPTPV